MFFRRSIRFPGYVRRQYVSNLSREGPRESPITHGPRPTSYIRRVDEDPSQPSLSPQDRGDKFVHRVQFLKGVETLGKTAHVIILNDRTASVDESDGVQEKPGHSEKWKSASELLEDLQKEKTDFRLDEVNENLNRLRSLYQPGHSLPSSDWEDLQKALYDGFSTAQLTKYFSKFDRSSGVGNLDGWRAGTSPYIDQQPVLQQDTSSRLPELKRMTPKKRAIQRIMRECWGLSKVCDEGQLDVHVDEKALSILMLPTISLMNMLAESLNVKIDISRPLSLIRITGNKNSCIEAKEQLIEWVSDVRSMEISLPVAIFESTAIKGFWEKTLLPWIESEFSVFFHVDWNDKKVIMCYLHSAELNANRARQTLYYAAIPSDRDTGLLTNFGNARGAHLYPVSCPDFMKLPDRQREWHRWIRTGCDDGRTLGRPPASIYGKGGEKPFHKLLEYLSDATSYDTRGLGDPNNVREVVTATVGQCLFAGDSPFGSDEVSFNDVRDLSSSRTFVNELPNTLPFLDSLEVAENKDNVITFSIRLLPSNMGAESSGLPELELELEAALPEDTEAKSTLVIPKIKRVSALVSSRNADMLLPEGPLDIRFNRSVYLDLLNSDDTEGTFPHTTGDVEFYSSLHECVKSFRLKFPLTNHQPHMPIFFNLKIPQRLLDVFGSRSTLQETFRTEPVEGLGYISKEYYIYPPVQCLAEASSSSYVYKDFDLSFRNWSMGPYLPTKSTDISLTFNLHSGERSPKGALLEQKPSSSLPMADSLRTSLLPFYLGACHLAFGIVLPQDSINDNLMDSADI